MQRCDSVLVATMEQANKESKKTHLQQTFCYMGRRCNRHGVRHPSFAAAHHTHICAVCWLSPLSLSPPVSPHDVAGRMSAFCFC